MLLQLEEPPQTTLYSLLQREEVQKEQEEQLKMYLAIYPKSGVLNR